MKASLNLLFPKAGGTFAGAVTAYPHSGTATNGEIVNVTYGLSETPPSGQVEGTIYIQYS